jgi:hypothetical protein
MNTTTRSVWLDRDRCNLVPGLPSREGVVTRGYGCGDYRHAWLVYPPAPTLGPVETNVDPGALWGKWWDWAWSAANQPLRDAASV